jgi:hypothetical protein
MSEMIEVEREKHQRAMEDLSRLRRVEVEYQGFRAAVAMFTRASDFPPGIMAAAALTGTEARGEMIERVGRSIATSHFSRRQWSGACSKADRVAWLVDHYWGEFEPDAKAVIKEMRQPASVMLAAADIASDDATENWQRMIDAALKD